MCTDIVSDIHEKQILYNISCPSVLWFQLPFRMVPPAGIEGLNITGAQRWNSMQKSATETSSRIKEPSALVCWSVGCVHAQYPFCGKSEFLSAAAALSAFNWTFCMCALHTNILSCKQMRGLLWRPWALAQQTPKPVLSGREVWRSIWGRRNSPGRSPR